MAEDALTADRWARFRHAVIGPLLVSPPAHGQLRAALRELSRKTFEHPTTGAPMRVGFSTLEKWYYAARAGDCCRSPRIMGIRSRSSMSIAA